MCIIQIRYFILVSNPTLLTSLTSYLHWLPSLFLHLFPVPPFPPPFYLECHYTNCGSLPRPQNCISTVSWSSKFKYPEPLVAQKP